MNRRSFFTTSAAAGAATAFSQAAGPFEREGSRLNVGLAAYSFRKFFKHQRGGKPGVPEDQQITMNDFISYCAVNGCQGAELTSYFFDQEIEAPALIDVRRHAFLRGVDIAGTAVGNNFTLPEGDDRDKQLAYVHRWIENAAVLGAPHIRVFAGRHAKGQDEEEAWQNVIATLRTAADYAGQHGVFLGIENHDSIGNHETLLRLVKDIDHPWVGVNLDTGNFRTADPYVDMEKCAPYAVNIQVKVEMKREGAAEKEPTDLKRVVDILKAANYQGYVILEYEAEEDPYKAVPPLIEQLNELCV
ncbi:MAG: sugar phosphate isomerase/epimerase [Verrucomicrobiales bacterium]|jgi:sugar phosphate isomerase/epimerase